jgi:glycosyltransferase involved in cell wall biosynthesis
MRYDSRIFDKECRGLTDLFAVHLFVADGKSSELKDNVLIESVAKPMGRISRMIVTPWKLFSRVRRENFTIYHFHDPELIPVAMCLKLLGKKVIYDVHEDVPNDILLKQWLPSPARYLISKIYAVIENIASARFDGIVCATPFIRDRFLKVNKNTIDIKNYPTIDQYATSRTEEKESQVKRLYDVCYVGVISENRGVIRMVEALDKMSVNFALAGRFDNAETETKLKSHPNWKRTTFFGYLNKAQIKDLLKQSYIGLVVLDPTITFTTSLPIKLFEYMAAGMPVISSDFSYWRTIVEKSNCGLCIPTGNQEALINAIMYLVQNRTVGETMGKNGKRAIAASYNWEHEANILNNFYSSLLPK